MQHKWLSCFIAAWYLLAQPIFSLDFDKPDEIAKSEPQVIVNLLVVNTLPNSSPAKNSAHQNTSQLTTAFGYSFKPLKGYRSLKKQLVKNYETKIPAIQEEAFSMRMIMAAGPRLAIMVVGTYNKATRREVESALFVLDKDNYMTEPVLFSVGSESESYFVDVYAIAQGENLEMQSAEIGVATDATTGPKRGKHLFRGIITTQLPPLKSQTIPQIKVSLKTWERSLGEVESHDLVRSEDESIIGQRLPKHESIISVGQGAEQAVRLFIDKNPESTIMVIGEFDPRTNSEKAESALFVLDKNINETEPVYFTVGSNQSHFINVYAIAPGAQVEESAGSRWADRLEPTEGPKRGELLYRGLFTFRVPEAEPLVKKQKKSLRKETIRREFHRNANLQPLSIIIYRLDSEEKKSISSTSFPLKKKLTQTEPEAFNTVFSARAKEKFGVSVAVRPPLNENTLLDFGYYDRSHRKVSLACYIFTGSQKSSKALFLRATHTKQYYVDVYELKDKDFKQSTSSVAAPLAAHDCPERARHIYHGNVDLIIHSNSK